MTAIKRHYESKHLFSLKADVNVAGDLNVKRPENLRAVLMAEKDSVLSVYGGEYLFSKFDIRLCERRGSDKGYKIRYGVNLIDANQERNCAGVYTGIYPYFYDETGEEETLVELDPKILELPGNFGYTRILPLDLSSELNAIPTHEALLEKAKAYIEDHDLGVPEVNITVEFAPLKQFEEYKQLAFLESVELGDTVGVYFEKIGISAEARVIGAVYNAILDRYKTVRVGDAKQDIVSTLTTMENAIREAVYKADNGIKSVARLTVLADSNAASIKTLTEYFKDEGGEIHTMAEMVQRADDQDASISAKVSKRSGTAESSFGWELTASQWQVTAGNTPIFVLTKDGARVIGYIEAKTGKIAGFDISEDHMSYGNMYIGTDLVGFGASPEDVTQFDGPFRTVIDSEGLLRSYKPYIYFPLIFGDVTFGGQRSDHVVRFQIPVQFDESCTVGGYDISDHESRIKALEDAISQGGGGQPEYDEILTVGAFRIIRFKDLGVESLNDLTITDSGGCWTWKDDGEGYIEFETTGTGSGTVTITGPDAAVLKEWTYLVE